MATYRQSLFVQNLIKLGNPTAAALAVYDIRGKNPRHIATNIASENLRKPAVRALLEEHGLDLRSILRVLKRNLHAKTRTWVRPLNSFLVNEDYTTQLKATELALRLKGYLGKGSSAHDGAEVLRPTEVNINYAD